MATALKGRDARTERIRQEVLRAAREQFLVQGFHGTSLDRIAAAAGYTKGVVYSRFESKADLFLALLEQRVEHRAEENRADVRGASGNAGIGALARTWTERQRNDLEWTLLVLEFRVHAARHPDLAERYAIIHQRTLDGIGEVIAPVIGADTAAARRRSRRLAQALHSVGNAITLEQAADADAFRPSEITKVARAIVEELA